MAVPASIGRTVWGDYQATDVLAFDSVDGNCLVTGAHSRYNAIKIKFCLEDL